MAKLLLAGVLLLCGIHSAAADAPIRPDATRPPAGANSSITEANYRPKLCRGTNGKKLQTTDASRPSTNYTDKLKKKQLADWNYADTTMGHYEEDHLISLELGGNDSSAKNLWPQPYETGATPYAGEWGTHVKDGLENELGRRICLAKGNPEHLSLRQARTALKTDWIKAYHDYVSTRTRPKLTDIMKAHCS